MRVVIKQLSKPLMAGQVASCQRSLHISSRLRQSNKDDTSLTPSAPSASPTQAKIEASRLPSGLQATNLFRTNKSGAFGSSSGVTATVFGGTGFLGKYVIDQLGTTGCQVVVPYTGDSTNVRHLKLLGDMGQIVPIPYSPFDADSIRKVVGRSNVVVNCINTWFEGEDWRVAANQPLWKNLLGGPFGLAWALWGKTVDKHALDLHDVLVKLTYRLAKSAKEAGVERFVHLSTLNPDKNSSSKWVRCKAEAEEVVREIYGDQAVILRCGPIYGEDDEVFINRLGEYIREESAVKFIGNGQNYIQPVFAPDVASAVFEVVSRNESAGQIYELAGDEKYKFIELLKMCHQETGDPLNVHFYQNYDEHAMWQQWRYGYMSLTMQEVVFPKEELDLWGVERTVRDGALTFKDLGISPSSFREKLNRLLYQYGGSAAQKPSLAPNWFTPEAIRTTETQRP